MINFNSDIRICIFYNLDVSHLLIIKIRIKALAVHALKKTKLELKNIL